MLVKELLENCNNYNIAILDSGTQNIIKGKSYCNYSSIKKEFGDYTVDSWTAKNDSVEIYIKTTNSFVHYYDNMLLYDSRKHNHI